VDSPQEQQKMLETHRLAWHTKLTASMTGDQLHLDDCPIPRNLLQGMPLDDIPASYPY